MSRYLVRAAALTAASALTGLLAAGTASAHVTAQIYGDEPTKGGYTAITLRVPGEEPDAATTALSVRIAEEYALTSVRTKPVPGWQAELTTIDLADVGEVVTGITWTAEPGHEIAAGTSEYQEFSFTAGPLPTDVDALVLPAAQTYEGGKVVNWDAPPPEDDADEPSHPAPVVPLADGTGEGGHSHGGSHGGSHGTAEGTGDTGTAQDSTARWLGGAGLAVGALGLGVGAGATLRARAARRIDT